MARQSTARRCSICRSHGHYSTTCQLKPNENRCMLFGSNLLRRKQGKQWTEEEHRAFLKGLEVYGASKWKHIAENLVKTRTPSQIASHAQKYYLWLKAVANDPEKKTKCSIFQIPTNQSTPISQVSFSTGGASEITSRAHHPFTNITAANPFSYLCMFPTDADSHCHYKWVVTNLRPTAAVASSSSSFSWVFDLEGIAEIYQSYEETNLWKVVENLPRGVHVNFF